ncbi:MAG: HAMP domain-containing histidine kinase [Colwellia sp.]|nr:HAMP domain-containing histidine kinase [Colwellia sp.]
MNSIKKLTSSHRFLLTNIIGVTALILASILASVIYITEKQGNVQLEQHTSAWAKSLAKTTVPYLQQHETNAPEKLKEQLKQLITSANINYIHIYKKHKNNQTGYFSGFKKSVYFPSIPDKINHIEQLSKIKHQKSYLELIVKIEQNQQFYGYLYIQYSNKTLKSFISKLTFIAIVFCLTGLLFLTIIVIFINKKTNQPITTIIESIQAISKNKDFSQRITKLPITELDILARTINILLSRIENHILKQNKINQQTLQQNSKLTGRVNARTDALKESNQELLSTLEKLHQFQAQLVEIEKMASLGDMVAGIAHEVNTPIGLGITASTLLADRLQEIKQSFEQQTLKSSQLKKFLIEGEENIAIIYRNLARAANLIYSFKKVAVDQSSADTRPFNVSELLAEVTLTLKKKTDQKKVKLTIDCPSNLIIESKPEPLNQILINLIINSIIHGFEDKLKGEITISISYLNENLHVNYQDDGIGIDENIKARVFDPFTTTKRGSGSSGLGLHLVFNLVTQALNGHIDFESDAEHGTLFNITFPVTLVSTNK